MTAFTTALAELEEAINNIDPRAIKDAVRNIRPLASGEDFRVSENRNPSAPNVGNIVENILQDTLAGEYDEAISAIKMLRSMGSYEPH